MGYRESSTSERVSAKTDVLPQLGQELSLMGQR